MWLSVTAIKYNKYYYRITIHEVEDVLLLMVVVVAR